MAGGQAPGMVIIPWYATGFRKDALLDALNEVAPVALRYGATSYAVYRSRDDRYKFQQLAYFEDLVSWERYWEGPEMIDFRARYSGWYQVPVLYSWWDMTVHGQVLAPTPAPNGGGNGSARGNGAPVGDAA